jgi:glutamine amidotransferase
MSNIVIIDYSCGNIDSVQSAFNFHNKKSIISRDHQAIKNADKIVLPGQGSFKTGIDNLKKFNLFELLQYKAQIEKIPILGICLGMQIFATIGFEGANEEGLDLIPGQVNKLKSENLKLPHIGWNQIKIIKRNDILKNIEDDTDFYFVHSYHYTCKHDSDILTTTNYHNPFVSAICRENVYGFQFHPEKSLKSGLKIIENFINI